MNLTDIANIRLISQQLENSEIKTAKDIVAWMGAMQAQDYAMAKWAVGIRLPNLTEQDIQAAINHAEIVRTHLLRPTWHLVSADDIYWLLELTAAHVKATIKSRLKELELSEAILTKSQTVMRQALSDGKHLSRKELVLLLEQNNIKTNENRASYLLLQAEVDGILCGGAEKDGSPTYALLEERIPKKKTLCREEALANLANRYFTSHGPATLQDFAWWSGLPAGDVRRVLAVLKSGFISETIGAQTYYWFANTISRRSSDKVSVHLLPAYDEFMISYKDRSASLQYENHNKAVSDNGIFRPVILINGKVEGVWKRTIKKESVIVEAEFFNQPERASIDEIGWAARQYGYFLKKEAQVSLKLKGEEAAASF